MIGSQKYKIESRAFLAGVQVDNTLQHLDQAHENDQVQSLDQGDANGSGGGDSYQQLPYQAYKNDPLQTLDQTFKNGLLQSQDQAYKNGPLQPLDQSIKNGPLQSLDQINTNILLQLLDKANKNGLLQSVDQTNMNSPLEPLNQTAKSGLLQLIDQAYKNDPLQVQPLDQTNKNVFLQSLDHSNKNGPLQPIDQATILQSIDQANKKIHKATETVHPHLLDLGTEEGLLQPPDQDIGESIQLHLVADKGHRCEQTTQTFPIKLTIVLENLF